MWTRISSARAWRRNKSKKVTAEKPWKNYLFNKVGYISNNKNNPELIFPGSFNPLHEGHLKMRELAEKKTGMHTTFEICAKNADKPPLTYVKLKEQLINFKMMKVGC